jgi:hypothetical protein
VLLTDHAVIGEAFGDERADRLLGFLVGAGDGARVALRLDEESGTEEGADDRPRRVGGRFGRRDVGVRDQGAGAFGEIDRR